MKQQRKLIIADTRNDITGPGDPDQQLPKLFQQFITGGVATGVINN